MPTITIDSINITYAILFVMLALGTVIGKARFKRFSLGSVGTLLIAILAGFIVQCADTYFYSSLKQDFSCFSSLGMYFFISAIGLETGYCFISARRKYLAALFCGIAMISLGAITAASLSLLFVNVDKAVIMGVFSGAMTSTPALSETLELTNNDNASIGYASAYFFGVVLAVLSVCIFLGKANSFEQKNKSNEKPTGDLFPIFVTIAIGITLGRVNICGYTAGETLMILFAGMGVGFIYKKSTHHTLNVGFIKNLGLALFFVGTGFSAGGGLAMYFSPILILIGFIITAVSIASGFLLTKAFRLTRADSLCVICGGMTSSPAYGALSEKNTEADSGMFTSAYIGALIALLTAVRLMKMFL